MFKRKHFIVQMERSDGITAQAIFKSFQSEEKVMKRLWKQAKFTGDKYAKVIEKDGKPMLLYHRGNHVDKVTIIGDANKLPKWDTIFPRGLILNSYKNIFENEKINHNTLIIGRPESGKVFCHIIKTTEQDIPETKEEIAEKTERWLIDHGYQIARIRHSDRGYSTTFSGEKKEKNT